MAFQPKSRELAPTLPHDDIVAIANAVGAIVLQNLEAKTLSKEDIQELIKEETSELVTKACKEAVHEIFAQLGLDIKGDNRQEVMRDFLFIREWRKFFADGKRHAWFAFLTAVVGGVGMAVLTYVRATGK